MPGNRPRWMLHLQAQFWRSLMGIGMFLHKIAPPRPPPPSFERAIDATVSPLRGRFKLHFYTPKGYRREKKLRSGKRYPCVVNFHGGGFCLGTATDDARWADVVVREVGAVVVSVAYRLAPEFPFPTAVEDGADAVLYLAQHADELMLDSNRFALSGFSSGGNMSFTVPLCLQGELHDRTPDGRKIDDGRKGSVPACKILTTTMPPPPPRLSQDSRPQKPVLLEPITSSEPLETNDLTPVSTNNHSSNSNLNTAQLTPHTTITVPDAGTSLNPSTTSLAAPGDASLLHPASAARQPLVRQKSRIDRLTLLRQTGTSTLSLVSSYKDDVGAVSVATSGSTAEAKILGIVSFYPPTDYTRTRAQRRATCARTDHQLPAVFTELFDDSYLQPPSLDLAHPWLSPGVAPTDMLRALPDDVVLFCCEWDMLLDEGEAFRGKLEKELGKRVRYHRVEGVPHGWDKAPNPLRESPGAREQYVVACAELKRMFGVRAPGAEAAEGVEQPVD